MIKIYYLSILILCSSYYHCQLGINTSTPDKSALLDINTSKKNGGLLIPRVDLLSISDNSTIPNPANGLLVYNKSDSGTGANKVFANYLYYYDVNEWKRLTNADDLINNNQNLPRIIAYGRKSARTACNTEANTSVLFALEPDKISNTALLSTSGQLTAPKKGYYAFSVSNTLNVKGAPSQSFNESPYITADGVTTYTTRFRGNATNLPQPRTITGVVYLLKDEQSSPFYWNLGQGNTCKTGTGAISDTSPYIGAQEIIWEYLGD